MEKKEVYLSALSWHFCSLLAVDVVVKCIGEEARYDGICLLFEMLQQPLLNKQVRALGVGSCIFSFPAPCPRAIRSGFPASFLFDSSPLCVCFCLFSFSPDDLRAAGFSRGRAVPRAEEGKALFLNRHLSKQEGCSGCGASDNRAVNPVCLLCQRNRGLCRRSASKWQTVGGIDKSW